MTQRARIEDLERQLETAQINACKLGAKLNNANQALTTAKWDAINEAADIVEMEVRKRDHWRREQHGEFFVSTTKLREIAKQLG